MWQGFSGYAAEKSRSRGLGVIATSLRGVVGAVRRRPAAFGLVALVTAAASVLLPPLVLSVARKPVDYFTFNPWLNVLPEYLASERPAAEKLVKLSNLALFWFSADSPFGGTEWGFAVDVRDVARIVVTALIVGTYFALWREARSRAGLWARAGAPGGALGALVSVAGLSTGPCSVMGCGAPVLPVVGLAFVGLSSGTLALLAGLANVATPVVLVALVGAVGWLGWRVARAGECAMIPATAADTARAVNPTTPADGGRR